MANTNDELPVVKIGVGAVTLLITVLVLLGSFVEIGPGQRGVLMRWGAVQNGVLDPGLHLKLPVADTVSKMDVQVQKAEQPEAASSLDLQNITTTVATNWHIDASDAEWVYQHIGNEDALLGRIIKPAISNSVKAVTALHNAEDLIVSRNKVRQQIEDELVSELKAYRIIVDSVNITDFKFSDDYAAAIEAKQVAQQKAQQASYELQKAEVVAKQTVVQAQAQADSQKLLQQSATPEILRLKALDKWNGVLPQVVGGNGVIPLIGSISSTSKSDDK